MHCLVLLPTLSKVFGRGGLGQNESPFSRRLTSAAESWIFDRLITVLIGGGVHWSTL